MKAGDSRIIRLGALAIAVSALFTAFALFLFIRHEKADFLASRLSSLSVAADLKADTILDFHRERLAILKFHASDPHLSWNLREALKGADASRADVISTFGSINATGASELVSLVDRRGRTALTVPPSVDPPHPSTGPAGAPRFLGIGRNLAGWPVLDYEAGSVDGSRLLMRVRGSTWLAPLVERWPGTEKSAETLIFRRDGDSLILLNEPRHKQGPGLRIRLPISGATLAARAARGEAGPLYGRDYRGRLCYGAVRDLTEVGLILVVKADAEEILAPLREKALLVAVAVGTGLALLAVLIILFLRSQADHLRTESTAEKLLLATAIEQAGESVVITDKDAHIIYTNPAFIRASGYSRAEARGLNPSVLKSGRHDAAFYKAMWDTLAQGKVWSGRLVNKRKDGTLYEEDSTITPVRGAGGGISHYIAVKRDVSAVKSLEDQLLHSQKMEAVGRLAGGVAHDFNNILTTINGYAEMLSDSAPPDSPLSADLAEILGAGRRAALLTRQLLTFSRRAPADASDIDLRAPIRALEKMLRRTLGEDIRLTFDVQGDPIWIHSDPGQIDQIVMNLAVNARDAMTKGGELSIRASITEFEADEMRMLGVVPAGRYGTLSVTDNGSGMEGEVLSRLFEPFFTTKEKGKGTGLGLAMVFGIVKQNNGHIAVDSAPGRGSTFTVYLPLIAAPAAAPASASVIAGSSRGDETILVAEDQDAVLRMVARTLTAHGYRVIACDSAESALAKARALEGPIHLLLSDVVMPGMAGEELALHLLSARPQTRVLYMSGYTDGRLDKLGESGEKIDLLLKPFTPEQVCRRVRDALDGVAPRMG